MNDKYVRQSQTKLRYAVGSTENFEMRVELRQSSTLTYFLFTIVIYCIIEQLGRDMLFANDVLCGETREGVKERLKEWQRSTEDRAVRFSRQRTEYLCTNSPAGEVKERRICRNMVRRFCVGSQKKGRPKGRWKDCMKECQRTMGLSEEEVQETIAGGPSALVKPPS